MAGPGNAIGETTTGITGFTGTSFTGTPVTQFDVIVGGATSSTLTSVGPGSAGQVLQSGGNAANPLYSTATYPAIATGTGTILRADGTNWSPTTTTYPNTNAINTLMYASSANILGSISAANDGVLITSNTGVPSFLSAGTTGQVLTATTGSPPSWASPATSGTVTTVSVVSTNGFAGTVANATTTPAITLSTTITGVLSGNGTAISGSAVTQYDVLVGGATNAISSVGPGSAGQVLQSGGNAANPAYSTATYPATATGTGTILRADGTNWAATTTTYPNTNAVNTIMYATSANVLGSISAVIDGVLISDHAAGVPSWLANGSAGFVLTANSGAPPSWQAASGGGLSWSVITADQSAVAAHGYICNKASALVLTLPASASIGDTIEVTGINTALGWKIAQNANQEIFFGLTSTTVGVTGYLQSSNIRDSVKIVCVVSGASSVYNVITSVGDITVV